MTGSGWPLAAAIRPPATMRVAVSVAASGSRPLRGSSVAALLADVGLHLGRLCAQLAVDLRAVLVVDPDRDHEARQRHRERGEQRGGERDLRAQAPHGRSTNPTPRTVCTQPRLAHLAAHVADEDVDRVAVDLPRVAPHLLEQLAAREDLAGVRRRVRARGRTRAS